MNAPKTRGAAIAAKCKDCIHDPAAAGTWREQVAACQSLDCPLWRFRPLQDGPSCPAWIKSHDPADLPEGWTRLEQSEAVRQMRQWNAGKANALRVQAGTSAPTDGAVPPQRVAPTDGADAPEACQRVMP